PNSLYYRLPKGELILVKPGSTSQMKLDLVRGTITTIKAPAAKTKKKSQAEVPEINPHHGIPTAPSIPPRSDTVSK
ncbi:MAG: hypothetical protein CEN92_442, partial [Candidatus Berkelbacteria bacterium Licking1014_96]